MHKVYRTSLNTPIVATTVLVAGQSLLFAPAAFAGNEAAFVSWTVPSQVATGAGFDAAITMKNTGTTTWSLANGYELGSENPMDNMTWGANRFFMDAAAAIAPGGEYTFTGRLTAPAAEGTYHFQWRMLQVPVEWFGAMTPDLQVRVTAPAFTCDGTEVLCLDMRSRTAVEASGGVVLGGDFNASGFQPSQQGGVDWEFGPERDFSAGELEVDVNGLLPVPGGEQSGGKVSIFEFCGVAPQSYEVVSLQKMSEDYRDGHIFRYGMNDDDPEHDDGWDAVIITGRDFGCYYSINDPPWQASESHHFRAAWSTAGLELWIDGNLHCVGRGNGDTFDPEREVFTIANRCTHFANQQAAARFTNLKLWARGNGQVTDAGWDAGGSDAGVVPDAAEDTGGVQDAGTDAGDTNAGGDDSGSADTGTPDASVDDAGVADAGGKDAGSGEEAGTAADAQIPSDAGKKAADAGEGDYGIGCGCATLGLE